MERGGGTVNKKTKKKAAAAAVTAVASASVLVGGLFSTPADLLGQPQTPAHTTVSVQDADGSSDQEGRRRSGSAIRQWILRLPVGVRALVGLPLWCVGWVILTGLGALWGSVLSPVAGTLAGWACLAALLIGVLALTAKAMFPDLPMKKILCKRNILGILAGVCAVGIFDTAAPYFWSGYEKFADAVRLTGSFLTVLIAVWALAVRERRRRKEAEPSPLSREEIQRRARKLADSVR